MRIANQKTTTLTFTEDELIEFLTTARSAQVESDVAPTFLSTIRCNGDSVYALEWYTNEEEALGQ